MACAVKPCDCFSFCSVCWRWLEAKCAAASKSKFDEDFVLRLAVENFMFSESYYRPPRSWLVVVVVVCKRAMMICQELWMIRCRKRCLSACSSLSLSLSLSLSHTHQTHKHSPCLSFSVLSLFYPFSFLPCSLFLSLSSYLFFLTQFSFFLSLFV